MHSGAVVLFCRAMLFDLDGVLVDSMGLIERILRGWALDHGLDADEAVHVSHGRRDVDVVRVVAPQLDAEVEARAIAAREARDFAGVAALPGAAELVAALPLDGWAVVTSATTAVARGRLRAAGLPVPSRLICAEDVTQGKPDPEGYVRAAELLNTAPNECVVVEDAAGGVAAARAAGMRCIGVGNPGAEYQVDDLRQVQVRIVPGGLRIEVMR